MQFIRFLIYGLIVILFDTERLLLSISVSVILLDALLVLYKTKNVFSTLFILAYFAVNLSAPIAQIILGNDVFVLWRDFDREYYEQSLRFLLIPSAYILVSVVHLFGPVRSSSFRIEIDKVSLFGSRFLILVVAVGLIYAFIRGDFTYMSSGYGEFSDTRKAGGLSRITVLLYSYILPWTSMFAVARLTFVRGLLRKTP